MTQVWLTLTGIDGRDIASPTEKKVAAVLAELFAQTEAASASLRFGYDDGLMYVAEVSNTGQVSFEEWSDRDCELALAPARQMQLVQAQALQLWGLMCKRQVSRIRELDW